MRPAMVMGEAGTKREQPKYSQDTERTVANAKERGRGVKKMEIRRKWCLGEQGLSARRGTEGENEEEGCDRNGEETTCVCVSV